MSGRGRGRGRGRGYAPPSGAQLFLRRSLDECGLSGTNIRSVHDITRPALFPDIRLHSTGDQRLMYLEDQKQQQEQEQQELEQQEQSGQEQAGQKQEDAAAKPEGEGGGAAGGPVRSKAIARPQQTVALIQKSREMLYRFQNSVHHVKPSKDVPDVVRYADAADPAAAVDASAVLSACLGGRKRTRAGLFVPDELASGQRAVRARAPSAGGIGDALAAGRAVSLTELADYERRGGRARSGSTVGVGAAGRVRSGSMAGPGVGADDGDDQYADAEPEEEEEAEDYTMNYYQSDEGEDDGDGDVEPTF